MKKTILILSILGIIACNSNEAPKPTGAQQPEKPADPEAQKGLDLVAANDCFQCHKISDQFQGPAYEEIAKRYKDDPAVIDSLSHKIIKGGSGNWGSVPMTPHPGLAQEEAKSMVKYVLSLK